MVEFDIGALFETENIFKAYLYSRFSPPLVILAEPVLVAIHPWFNHAFQNVRSCGTVPDFQNLFGGTIAPMCLTLDFPVEFWTTWESHHLSGNDVIGETFSHEIWTGINFPLTARQLLEQALQTSYLGIWSCPSRMLACRQGLVQCKTALTAAMMQAIEETDSTYWPKSMCNFVI